jgi:hypothetical protein
MFHDLNANETESPAPEGSENVSADPPPTAPVSEECLAALRQLFDAAFGPTIYKARAGFEPGETCGVRAYVRYERSDGSVTFERSVRGRDERSAFEALCRKVDRHAEDRRCRIVVSREDLRAAMGWSK